MTGGARGIGAAIATDLARGGFDIAVLDVTAAEATLEAVNAAGRKGIGLVGDVGAADDRAAALAARDDEMGRLDLLVNNAGVAPSARADILQAALHPAPPELFDLTEVKPRAIPHRNVAFETAWSRFRDGDIFPVR